MSLREDADRPARGFDAVEEERADVRRAGRAGTARR